MWESLVARATSKRKSSSIHAFADIECGRVLFFTCVIHTVAVFRTGVEVLASFSETLVAPNLSELHPVLNRRRIYDIGYSKEASKRSCSSGLI
ncbi:hypothetical protein AVEN_145605-1 [Araneus ventricosus]|uniref:Uncharacterized protein n=1 Tax=Araneus ventricosus TaxID=182803 RepID=A0A4Y2KQG9_ARAVE|nr:hypothetical protein AVEN_145605-1 [Araneus ventricosus]